jgi:uncharacterized protein
VKAMGVAQARWVGDYFRHARKVPSPHPDSLVDSGDLIRVNVDGWRQAAYVHRDHRALLKRATQNDLHATHSTLLSPFDPLVWDRERALHTWDFDYRIECYTPEARRQYGYFTLPMLVNGSLVGRLDAKAHRVQKMFELKTVHFERSVQFNGAMDGEVRLASLAQAVVRAASWHGANQIVLRAVKHPGDDKKSERLLSQKLSLLLENAMNTTREIRETGKA